jgi:hypothetical protein
MNKMHIINFWIFTSALLSIWGCKKADAPEINLIEIKYIGQEKASVDFTYNYPASDYAIEIGICWSTNPSPRKTDNYKVTNPMAEDGMVMTGLSPNTKYYVTLYGKFNSGEYYSNELSFNTLDVPFVNYNGNNLYYYTGALSVNVAEWGPDGLTTANSATNGASNTAQISNFPGFYIAKVCSQLNVWGYDDWYLPSLDEMTTFFIQGGILSNQNSYWTSTEFDISKAYQLNGSSGSTNTLPKSYNGKCFCVRKN